MAMPLASRCLKDNLSCPWLWPRTSCSWTWSCLVLGGPVLSLGLWHEVHALRLARKVLGLAFGGLVLDLDLGGQDLGLEDVALTPCLYMYILPTPWTTQCSSKLGFFAEWWFGLHRWQIWTDFNNSFRWILDAAGIKKSLNFLKSAATLPIKNLTV